MTSILVSNPCIRLLGDGDCVSKSRTSKIPCFNCSNLDSASNGLFSFKSSVTGGKERRRKLSPVFAGTLDGAIDPDESEDERGKQENSDSEIGGVIFIS